MKIILFYIFHVFYKLLASLLLTSKVRTVIQVDLISHFPSALLMVVTTQQDFSLQGDTSIANM